MAVRSGSKIRPFLRPLSRLASHIAALAACAVGGRTVTGPRGRGGTVGGWT
jgi:hypothetical protein